MSWHPNGSYHALLETLKKFGRVNAAYLEGNAQKVTSLLSEISDDIPRIREMIEREEKAPAV